MKSYTSAMRPFRVRHFLLLLPLLLSASVAHADEDFIVSGNDFKDQGICIDPVPVVIERQFGTRACANGVSQYMLSLHYQSGFRDCIFIDNANHQLTFFVPLKTKAEYLAFFNNHPVPDITIIHGCEASSTISDGCGGFAHVNEARNGHTVVINGTGTYKSTWQCVAASTCGAWQKVSERGACATDGDSGTDDGNDGEEPPVVGNDSGSGSGDGGGDAGGD
jgi:hypothetical protein